MEIEKIKDVIISSIPIVGSDKRSLKLLVPNNIVEALGIKATKDCGRKATLYISPPVDSIKIGDEITLVYKIPAYDSTKEDKPLDSIEEDLESLV